MLQRGAIGQYALGQLESLAPAGSYTLAADQGTYTLTGQDAILRYGHVLMAAAGSYTLTGQDATLSRDRRIACATGSYTITGQAASLLATRVLFALPNTRIGGTVYSYFGFAALGQVAFGQSVSDTATTPAYTYTINGYDTVLRRGFSISADAGAYTLTGQSALGYFTRAIIAGTGTYTLTGQAAPSIITMPAAAGSYTLTGNDVAFLRVRKRIRGFARVGSPITARAA